MTDIAGAFEQYLTSLTDTEYEDLTRRVRGNTPPAPPAGPPLPNELEESTTIGKGKNAGLEEARRRGYVQ
jgi:hypothetical protein